MNSREKPHPILSEESRTLSFCTLPYIEGSLWEQLLNGHGNKNTKIKYGCERTIGTTLENAGEWYSLQWSSQTPLANNHWWHHVCPVIMWKDVTWQTRTYAHSSCGNLVMGTHIVSGNTMKSFFFKISILCCI